MDPDGAKIVGNCLSHNEVDLPKTMLDIVGAISRRIMMILHTINSTINWLLFLCNISLEGINT